MSDDNFEDIVNGMGDSDEAPEFESMMDVIFYYYKKFNPGSIPVKGMFIMESTAPGIPRRVECETSAPMTMWEALGLLEYVSNDLKQQDMLDILGIALEAADGDDDDD